MGAEKITVRNLRIRGIDLDENLLMVEGAVPGPRDGYVLISKAKSPPRERRGFGGAGTVDPLKASKKASGEGEKEVGLAVQGTRFAQWRRELRFELRC